MNPGTSSRSPPSSSGVLSKPETLLRYAYTPHNDFAFFSSSSEFPLMSTYVYSWLWHLPDYGRPRATQVSTLATSRRYVLCCVFLGGLLLAGWATGWVQTHGSGSSRVRTANDKKKTPSLPLCSFRNLPFCRPGHPSWNNTTFASPLSESGSSYLASTSLLNQLHFRPRSIPTS